MRVRPVFWLLLAATCISLLAMALFVPTHAPAVLQVHVEQQALSPGRAILHVHLMDSEGTPIDQAQIASDAQMTNMKMSGDTRLLRVLGGGDYLVAVDFSMSGPWLITVHAQADGFTPQQETLFLHVEDNVM